MKMIIKILFLGLLTYLLFAYFLIKINHYDLISFIFGEIFMGLYLGICDSINRGDE